MEKVKRIAKAVVAVAGFVALVAGQVADGHYDVETLYTAGVALLVVLGVYRIPNSTPAPPPADVVAAVRPAPDAAE